MNHPDPLARGWPGQGRAGLGFVGLRIRPGPPWSILRLLGGCCSAGVGSAAGSGGGGGRDEEGSGMRGTRRRKLRAPRCDGGTAQMPLVTPIFPDHACVWCPGLCHQPSPSQELHQDVPSSTPWVSAPPALMGHPQNTPNSQER